MIRPIINFADKYTTKALNTTFNTSFFKKGNDSFKGWSATGIVVASLLSKDLVNCAYYVYQSLNNERIPEEKRKFVAAMDLANGILNVLVQLAVASPIQKFAEKIYDNHIEKKLFNAKEKARLYNIASNNGANFIEKAVFDTAYKIDNKTAKSGFVAVMVLLGLQTFVKRVVTPLIATPMATHLKPLLKSDKEMAEAEATHSEKNTDSQKDKAGDNVASATTLPKTQDVAFSKFV